MIARNEPVGGSSGKGTRGQNDLKNSPAPFPFRCTPATLARRPSRNTPGSRWRNKMPEGDLHKEFCQKWGIITIYCPYGLYNRKGCPLDAKRKHCGDLRNGAGRKCWHHLHDDVLKNAGYSSGKPLTIERCSRWVRGLLRDKMERYFGEFCSQLSDVDCEKARKVRLCWTAHLVADFASSDWWCGTGQKMKYRNIKDPRFREFVTEVGEPILSPYKIDASAAEETLGRLPP